MDTIEEKYKRLQLQYEELQSNHGFTSTRHLVVYMGIVACFALIVMIPCMYYRWHTFTQFGFQFAHKPDPIGYPSDLFGTSEINWGTGVPLGRVNTTLMKSLVHIDRVSTQSIELDIRDWNNHFGFKNMILQNRDSNHTYQVLLQVFKHQDSLGVRTRMTFFYRKVLVWQFIPALRVLNELANLHIHSPSYCANILLDSQHKQPLSSRLHEQVKVIIDMINQGNQGQSNDLHFNGLSNFYIHMDGEATFHESPIVLF